MKYLSDLIIMPLKSEGWGHNAVDSTHKGLLSSRCSAVFQVIRAALQYLVTYTRELVYTHGSCLEWVWVLFTEQSRREQLPLGSHLECQASALRDLEIIPWSTPPFSLGNSNILVKVSPSSKLKMHQMYLCCAEPSISPPGQQMAMP